MKIRNFLLSIAVAGIVSATAVTMVSANASYDKGDVNCDGEISIEDVTQLQKHIAEIDCLPNKVLPLADINDDGYVNIQDATYVQKVLAEIINMPTTQPETQPTTDDGVIHLPFVPVKR